MTVAELIAKLELDAQQFVAGTRASVAALDQLESKTAITAGKVYEVGGALSDTNKFLIKYGGASNEAAAGANNAAQAFELKQRKLQALAGGLVDLSGTSSVATQSLFILANAAEVAGKSLGEISIILVGIAAVAATVQLAKDFVTLGTTAERYLETLQQIQEEERARLQAREAVVGAERSQAREAARFAAEAAATRRRMDGDEVSAIREVQAARVAALQGEEEEEINRLKASARYRGGQIDGERAIAAIRNRYRQERGALDAAADAAVDAAARARTAREIEQEQAITDAVNARYQAQLAGQKALLDQQQAAANAALDLERNRKTPGALPGIERSADAEPKLRSLLALIDQSASAATSAARVAFESRVAQIDAETKKAIAAVERQVETGEILQDRAARLKGEREAAAREQRRQAETELGLQLFNIEVGRIKSVEQERDAAFQRQVARSQAFQALIRAAEQASNEASTAVAAAEGRIAEVVALQSRERIAAVRRETTDRITEIQRQVREGVLTEQEGAKAREIANLTASRRIIAALAAEQEAKRQVIQQGAGAETGFGVQGGFLQGKTKIDDFVSKSQALVQAYAQLVAGGTPVADVIQDIQRDAEAAAKAYDKLASEFKGSPALLAELEKRGRAIRFGDVVQQVRDTAKSLREIQTGTTTAADAIVPLTDELAGPLRQALVNARSEGYGFIGMLVQLKGWVDAAIPSLREMDALLSSGGGGGGEAQ